MERTDLLKLCSWALAIADGIVAARPETVDAGDYVGYVAEIKAVAAGEADEVDSTRILQWVGQLGGSPDGAYVSVYHALGAAVIFAYASRGCAPAWDVDTAVMEVGWVFATLCKRRPEEARQINERVFGPFDDSEWHIFATLIADGKNAVDAARATELLV